MASTPYSGLETKLYVLPYGATSVRFLHMDQCILLISPTASVVLLGAMVALPSCFLCISRRLEAITSIGIAERRRGKTYDRAFEAVTCLLLPALYMGLRALYWYLAADILELTPTQIQLFRTVALLYLKIMAARQLSKTLCRLWLSCGFHLSASL
jgi:Pheromone A receptor